MSMILKYFIFFLPFLCLIKQDDDFNILSIIILSTINDIKQYL